MILHRHRRAQPKSSSDTGREHQTSVVEPRATRQIGMYAAWSEGSVRTLDGLLKYRDSTAVVKRLRD